MPNFKFNKRGEVGETLTWVFATLIIIFVIIFFVALSLLMSKFKTINAGDVQTDLGKNSEQLAVKTSIAEQLNNQNKQEIENILQQQNGG
jgi:hypothetical protein